MYSFIIRIGKNLFINIIWSFSGLIYNDNEESSVSPRDPAGKGSTLLPGFVG